jgi:hypothetical protein
MYFDPFPYLMRDAMQNRSLAMHVNQRTNETVPISLSHIQANSAIKPNTPPITTLKSLSTLLTAAPVKVAILGLVVCDCAPDWNAPVAVIVPQEYEPEAAAKLPVGCRAAAAGTRATLVAVTTSTEVAPGAPFVAGGGVAVTNETRGTVTAVVMMVTVEAEEMVWV